MSSSMEGVKDLWLLSCPVVSQLCSVDALASFITELFNRSLSRGVFPAQFKAANITSLLKTPDLDPSDWKSYRPIFESYCSIEGS